METRSSIWWDGAVCSRAHTCLWRAWAWMNLEEMQSILSIRASNQFTGSDFKMVILLWRKKEQIPIWKAFWVTWFCLVNSLAIWPDSEPFGIFLRHPPCAPIPSRYWLSAPTGHSHIYIYYIIVEQLRSCKVLSDKLGISPVETDIMCFVQSALLQVLERPAGSREAERLRQWITKTCGIKTGPSTSVTWDSDWRAAELCQHWISVSIFAQEEASPPKPLPCQSTCQNGGIFFRNDLKNVRSHLQVQWR